MNTDFLHGDFSYEPLKCPIERKIITMITGIRFFSVVNYHVNLQLHLLEERISTLKSFSLWYARLFLWCEFFLHGSQDCSTQ
jgi:hypothetical protein